MATINTDAPSTGKTIPVFVERIEEAGSILFECNDFTVPIREEGEGVQIIVVDGEERQLVNGEALFITPITVANNTDDGAYIRLTIFDEVTNKEYEYVSQVYIPGKETVQIGINGLSLVKQKENRTVGEMGPYIKGYAIPEDLTELGNENTNLSATLMVSEAEAGTHAPAFKGIF